jgi:hypothetical protein
MFEKLNLNEIVRYFLSGIVTLFSIHIAADIPIDKTAEILSKSIGLIPLGTAAAFTAVIALSGYFLFTFYRRFVYEFLILPFKGWLGGLLRVRTYRDFIRELVGTQISSIEAERLYITIKSFELSAFYKDMGTGITVSFHSFYFSVILLFVSTLLRFPLYIWYNVFFLGAFFVVMFMDWHFERLELLIFQYKREEISKILNKIFQKP